VAYIKALAKERGRNERWAERSVRESASIDAETALDLGVIDVIADDEQDLIMKLEGRKVKVHGQSVVLLLRERETRHVKMTLRERLLLLLTNPNIAYILLLLGIYGLFFELQNPGMIFPGVVGSICLILGFYSLHLLPVNYAGLALIFLSAIMFILEIYITSHGFLTIGGIVALIFGSVILFESDVPYLRVSWEVIMIVVIVIAAFVIFLLTLGVRAQLSKKVTGSEGIVGEVGIARTDITPEGGTIYVHGEYWSAISEVRIKEGKRVRVIEVQKTTLKVEAADAA